MTLKANILTELDTVFFNNNEFSEYLTLTPAGMEARTIKGIFTESYEAVNPDTGEVESTAPTALVMSTDSDIITQGDVITRETGKSLEIINVKPESAGTTMLTLSRDGA